ncbi:uncharacterized protein LOC113350689 [Papaver somniferum]|uniref:uncharacterized protein LOC113350689 n=1 Tax=Papaver somniferum TaxID=3469 RepID=UPI000E6F7BE1|nr:uncharacterized protein LOC113350689 [Papaver somniferum]
MVAQTCKELQETNNRQQSEINTLHSKVNNLALQLSTMSTKDDLQPMKIGWVPVCKLLRQILKKVLKRIFKSVRFFFSNRDLNKNQDASSSNTGGFHSNFHSGGHDSSQFYRMPKLDFPRFNGDNPKSWIQKCEYYFQMHNINEPQKTWMAAIHLDSKANKWYDNFCLTKTDITWPYFCNNVCARFENLVQDNIVGLFNKLAKLTTVDSYFEEFEYYKALLLGIHHDFPEYYFIASFIGGLKEELRSSVLMFDPKTFLHAFSLARMQEKTLVIQQKVHARKAQGLCFNCDETYKRGHICKKQYLRVLIGEEAEEIYDTGGDTSHETDEEPALESDMEIFLHALTGNVSGDTIRIPGFIKKKAISILIDTGSTHSFIDSALAASWNGLCKVTSCGDLRLLPLGGCDIVFGADWLRNLGDVLFNLSKLCITFKHKGQLFSITSSPVPLTTPPPIKNLLNEFSDMFNDKKTLPSERNLDHQIPLKPKSAPVNLRPYRSPYIQKSIVENLVKEMLHSGIIQPSHSPFASPILLVKKKDNTWRFCVDYRKLNNITIKYKFPIPIIDELLDELHGSKFFIKIDLKSGYHQIIVSPSDIHKTAFRTHHGNFEFKVMPFGLTNPPATIQALMNDIFKDHLRKFILVFFDDILVYSPSLEDHLLHLQTTLELLRRHQLTTNLSKCSFCQSEIEYLGHLITGNGVMADPAKISAMVELPTSRSLSLVKNSVNIFFRVYLLMRRMETCTLSSRLIFVSAEVKLTETLIDPVYP